MSLVELVWVSFMDERLARRSVESFTATGLPRRVLVNGRWRGTPLPADVEVTETGRFVNLADAFNVLMHESRCDFVMFVDTDMVWPSGQSIDGLSRVLAAMDPAVAICALRQVDVHDEPLASGAVLPLRLRRMLQSHAVTRAPALGGTIYRTTAVREVGGLDHILDWGDHDVDLTFRLLRTGWTVAEVDHPHLIHDYQNTTKPQRSGRTFRALCTRAAMLRARASSRGWPETLGRAAAIGARALVLAASRPTGRREHLRRGNEAVLACLFAGRQYVCSNLDSADLHAAGAGR